LSPKASFEIVPVWKKVRAELCAELLELWERSQAIPDRERAIRRAREAVCVARDPSGAICGVGTAVVRVLPRLRQPLYYYRQFFAPEFRGHKRALPFFNEARRLLEGYNESLPAPESIGMLLELENQHLVARYERAYEPAADSTFIGYSPAGLQLRVSYFKNARLLQPVAVDAGAVAKCA
jgi:hypothetical protein